MTGETHKNKAMHTEPRITRFANGERTPAARWSQSLAIRMKKCFQDVEIDCWVERKACLSRRHPCICISPIGNKQSRELWLWRTMLP